MATDAAPRAPRLTEGRLADLELATTHLQSEIDYLAGAFPDYGKDHPLHKSLKDRHDSLVRARDWIAGKVTAERAHRTEGAEA